MKGRGAELIVWLNAEPAVRAVLARHFEGQPINAQNLSDWRRGGYADWCQQQQILELAERLHAEGEELDALDGDKLAGHLALASTLAVAGRLRAAERMEEGPAKFRAVMATVRAVDRLRRTEIEAGRAKREAAVAERQVGENSIAAVRRQSESPTRKESHRGALPERAKVRAPVTSAPTSPAPVVAASAPIAVSARAGESVAKKAAVVERAATVGATVRPVGPLAVPSAAASRPISPAMPAASAKTGGFVYPWMNGAEEGFRELQAAVYTAGLAPIKRTREERVLVWVSGGRIRSRGGF